MTAEMQKQNQSIGPRESISRRNFLIVGPLPPPIGGSPLTLKVMLEEFENYPEIDVSVINTSPLRHVSKKMTGFNFEKVKRMFTILGKYRREIANSDAVLVFANDLFAFVLVPLLLRRAKRAKKPIFLKPVGSGLDLFMESHGKMVKSIMLNVLRSMDGILAQTQFLANWLKNEGCNNAFYLPGCRSYEPVSVEKLPPDGALHLIFIAHITLLKGPIILLKALQLVSERKNVNVTCDFYGPIHDDIREKFNDELRITNGTKYMGVAEAGKGTETIAKYDVLILPTCYDTEGHPGVLIEAMHAGVPIISTQIRTLPELVDQGINGLLVQVGDHEALANAIEQLALDHDLRIKMGTANFDKGHEFRSDVVVDQLIHMVFPDFQNNSRD